MRKKLQSRKFWMSVAAFLGSIAASIAGIITEEKWITITGVVCGMLSAAIYACSSGSIYRWSKRHKDHRAYHCKGYRG